MSRRSVALNGVRQWLQQQVPNVRIITATEAGVPVVLLLESLHDPARVAVPKESISDATLYTTWHGISDLPLNHAAFESFDSDLPPEVVRGKDVLWLDDARDEPMIYQQVGARRELRSGGAWHGALCRSQIVLIGLADMIHWQAIDRQFHDMGARDEY